MKKDEIINNFWNEIVLQNAEKLLSFFTIDACIKWHNSNECFNVSEYIRANCEYPNEWKGEVERLENIGNISITVTRVWTTDETASFRVTSFFKFENNKISALDEYWGEDGIAPQWRLDKCIGKPIK